MKHIAIALAVILFLAVPTARAEEGEVEQAAYTSAEAELLARVLYSECRGEPVEGQYLVAQCAIDRLESGIWGDTLKEVLESPNQFAKPGKLDEELLKVSEAVLGGERYDPDVRILYFRRTKSVEDWYAKYLYHVGCHAAYGFMKEPIA